jgi:hypothetical protein
MRKIILIAIVAVLISGKIAIGQVGFGLKGGLNLTTLKFDDPNGSYNSKTGFHVGPFLRIKAAKFAVQPEALLFTQQVKGSFTTLGNVEDRFTYLSIPVMLKLYAVAGLNIQVGPQFGFLLDGERKISTVVGSTTSNIKDSYKDSDLAISAGAGWDISSFSIDVRYNFGLKDINDGAGDKINSRIFLVSLGWNFLK